MPDTHKPALHTGSSTPRFCCDADPNPKQGSWTVHDKMHIWRDLVFSALWIKKAIPSSLLFFYLLFCSHVGTSSSLAFAYSHQGEIKPGKMQKCCRTVGANRNPSGLIQDYNRAHCTVQLKNKFFVK